MSCCPSLSTYMHISLDTRFSFFNWFDFCWSSKRMLLMLMQLQNPECDKYKYAHDICIHSAFCCSVSTRAEGAVMCMLARLWLCNFWKYPWCSLSSLFDTNWNLTGFHRMTQTFFPPNTGCYRLRCSALPLFNMDQIAKLFQQKQLYLYVIVINRTGPEKHCNIVWSPKLQLHMTGEFIWWPCPHDST